MADIDKRLKFYNGQFLQQQDFTDEQQYHLDRLRRHNRQMHTYGVAEGLTVTANLGATSAVVAPGTALDGEGRQIVLPQSRTLSFSSFTNQWVLVVISYTEQPSDPASVGDEGDTRWWERPDVAVIPETGAPAADVRIRLARLLLAANGTVSQHDTTVRTSAGVKLGTEVSIERIRLSRSDVSSNLWPTLSSGAAQQADLAGNFNVTGNIAATGSIAASGNLTVTGNIAVTGTVDGRDVSADGANNDTHRKSTDNPHATTAAQIGALASVAGVSNPGGDIALTGQGGIVITGNDEGNTINFNMDVARTGIFSKRAYATAFFSQADGDGAIRTINLGFQPKFIWFTGTVNAVLAGYPLGGPVTGHCQVGDNLTTFSMGNGPYIYRFSSLPYIVANHLSWFGSNVVAYSCLIDNTTSPPSDITINIYIEPSTTGFSVKFGRATSSGYKTPDFNVHVAFSALG